MSPEQKNKAQTWNHPQMLRMVEEGRYPYQRAFSSVIANAIRRHVEPGGVVFEVGAGLGYLKDLVPAEYHTRYITSDYNAGNLAAGTQRRQIQAVAASAFELPLADSSVDCVVDMDAYDTLPNLGKALSEARRVLVAGGSYIHFQVNFPSDDTVWDDHPGYVFFPATFEQGNRRGPMVGVKRDDLLKGLRYISTPAIKSFMSKFLTDYMSAYTQVVNHSTPIEASRMVQTALAVMPIDRMVIPSVPQYFQEKLERIAKEAGLQVKYSHFVGTVFRGSRSQAQTKWPNSNEFSMEQGDVVHTKNPELISAGSTDVVEKVSLLVFIAQKPSKDLFKFFLPEELKSSLIKFNPKS